MKLTFDNICKTLIFVLFIILISHFLTYCSDMVEGVVDDNKVSKKAPRRAARKASKKRKKKARARRREKNQGNTLMQAPTPITRGFHNINEFCVSSNPCDVLNHVKYLNVGTGKLSLRDARAIDCVNDNDCIKPDCKTKLEGTTCAGITHNLYADLENYHICKSNNYKPPCDMNAYNIFMNNMENR